MVSICLFTSLLLGRENSNTNLEEYCNDAKEIMELALDESDLKSYEYLNIEGLNVTTGKEMISFTEEKLPYLL